MADAPIPLFARDRRRNPAALSVMDPVRPRPGFAPYIVNELGNTPSTAFTYECNLTRMERFVGKGAADFLVLDVRHFLRDSPFHPATRSGALVALRAYVRFGLIEGWWVDIERAQALLSLRGPRQRKRRKRPLSLNEVHTVLDACRSSNDHRAVYLPLYQGLRISDSARLREPDFWEDRLAFESVKGNKYLELPLHPEVAQRKELILQRSPSRDSLKHTCRSLSHYTGIKFTSHTLRRTFSRRLDDLGIQEGVVIELLGHEQVTVYRKHYAGVSWPAMVAAMAALWY